MCSALAGSSASIGASRASTLAGLNKGELTPPPHPNLNPLMSPAVSLTLAPQHWDRILVSLSCHAENLHKDHSGRAPGILNTFEAVEPQVDAMLARPTITLRLSRLHWLRIRVALSAMESLLGRVGSEKAGKYQHTYELVKLGTDRS